MKRFYLLSFLFWIIASSAAYAQYIPENKGYVTSRGAKIFCDGETLTKDEALALFSDYGGLDRSEFYASYRKGYRVGVGLAVGGASSIVLGSMMSGSAAVAALVLAFPLAMSEEPMPVAVDAFLYTGLALTSVGTLAMLAGIPTAIVYRVRVKDLAMGYNAASSSRSELTFGPTASGVGFALKF